MMGWKVYHVGITEVYLQGAIPIGLRLDPKLCMMLDKLPTLTPPQRSTLMDQEGQTQATAETGHVDGHGFKHVGIQTQKKGNMVH